MAAHETSQEKNNLGEGWKSFEELKQSKLVFFYTLVSKQSHSPSHGIKATDDDLYLKVIATYNLVEIVNCEGYSNEY